MDTAWHRRVISGHAKGLSAWSMRGLWWGMSFGYGLAVRARNLSYRWGCSRVERAPIPVISLGNITTGGTGKTPFAAFIARWFRERLVRVAFLSRGYGAEPGRVNDEALVLDLLCPDVPHLQHPDRVASARIAVEELESQLLVLDDGFQHRRLARDLDIVLVDALQPWGFGHLLPRGLLREPLSSLRRADLVVLTRVDQAEPSDLERLRRRLKRILRGGPWVETRFANPGLINSAGETCPWDAVRTQPAAAFCGIGNPQGFRQTLQQAGISLAPAAWREFPDHHPYSGDDVRELQQWFQTLGARVAFCTQKDLVKLAVPRLGQTDLRAVQQEVEILSGRELLETRLQQIADRIPNEE